MVIVRDDIKSIRLKPGYYLRFSDDGHEIEIGVAPKEEDPFFYKLAAEIGSFTAIYNDGEEDMIVEVQSRIERAAKTMSGGK